MREGGAGPIPFTDPADGIWVEVDLAAGIGGLSGRMRRTQTGFVRSYALSMLGGAVLIAGALLLVRIG